jgi:hypothetical protein
MENKDGAWNKHVLVLSHANAMKSLIGTLAESVEN